MKKSTPIAAAALTAALLAGGALPAHAQWGDPGSTSYCAPSVACYTDASGSPHTVPYYPKLNAQDEKWLLQCQHGIAASAVKTAITLKTKGWMAALGAAVSVGKVIYGPCKSLVNSPNRKNW